MAEVEAGIFGRLSGQTALTNLVGTKIFPGMAPPRTAMPYITYFKVSDYRVHAMRGDPGLAGPRIQVDVWSTSFTQAKSISIQVRTALQDFSGSTGGVAFQRIFFEDENSFTEMDLETDEPTYHISQDYFAWHD